MARLCHQGFPSQIGHLHNVALVLTLFFADLQAQFDRAYFTFLCLAVFSLPPPPAPLRYALNCARARANAKLTHVPSLIDRKEMMGEPRPLTDFHRFVHNLDFGRGTRAFPGTNQLPNPLLLALHVIH